MRIKNFLLVLPITSILFSGGGCDVSLFADPSKTGESMESLFDRSDKIGSKFHKAYQPLKLNYQWKNKGIIVKSGKGKPHEVYIDGRTGKIKTSNFQDSAGRKAVLHFSLLNQLVSCPGSSDSVSITLKIPLTDRSEYFGLILKGL